MANSNHTHTQFDPKALSAITEVVRRMTRAVLLGTTLLKVANAGPDEIVELPPEFPWSLVDHMDADEIRDWFGADR